MAYAQHLIERMQGVGTGSADGTGKPSAKVMIIAGEASGDQHGARLVSHVHQLAPWVRFYGIGGQHMRQAGVRILVDAAELAVVGLIEVLKHYRHLSNVLDSMRRTLREDRPDLLILIDYPDFNLRLAKTAHALGIKVLYYISPQVWAWRQHRVITIGKRIDMMAVVFPFELPFYEAANIPVRFVGHPLTEEVHSDLTRDQAAMAAGLDPHRPIVGLFPGSRRNELQKLLPLQIDAARLLKSKMPAVQFILPRASTLDQTEIDALLCGRGLEVKCVSGDFYNVIQSCDAIVSASGTATLEIALMGKPLVAMYHVNRLSYLIMRRLIKVEHIALCNIVAGRRVAAELIQNAATPTAIANELGRLLNDPEYTARLREGFSNVRDLLTGGHSSTDIAALTLEMLDHIK